MLKTHKEHMQEKSNKDKHKNAQYDELEKGPIVKNWSATMPAFCYTELCPDKKYRRKRDGEM